MEKLQEGEGARRGKDGSGFAGFAQTSGLIILVACDFRSWIDSLVN